MNLQRPSLGGTVGSVALVVLIARSIGAQSAGPQNMTAGCQGIEVVSDELTRPEAEKYCRFAVDERKKVEKYWGATWREPIRIQVSSAYAIARSLVTNGA